MLEFSATAWTAIVRELDSLASVLNLDATVAIAEGKTGGLIESLGRIASGCRVLGLDLSVSYAEELIERLRGWRGIFDKSKPDLPPVELARECAILRKRIDDQLAGRLFIGMTKREASEYSNPREGWERVIEKFPGAVRDIEEASKCVVFGRATASAFHLMLIVERGLRALGASLKDSSLDPRTNPSWGKILGRCDRELQKPIAGRSTEWRSDEKFFSTATANLRAVQYAWRNPTLHVDQFYTLEEAREISAAIRGFMHHLATKLSE